jgi:hypothetical protein
MSDHTTSESVPPPASAVPPPTSAVPQPTPAAAPATWSAPPYRRIPEDLSGVFYSTGLTILLTFVTLGVWGAFWSYHTGEDLKRYNGDGFGGTLNAVMYALFWLFFAPLIAILMFTIPNEISRMYKRDGQQPPVSALWGLWWFLPIIGWIVWYVKVQDALNTFWRGKGARSV